MDEELQKNLQKWLFESLSSILKSAIDTHADNENAILQIKEVLEEYTKICDQILWNIDTHRGENEEEYSDDETEF